MRSSSLDLKKYDSDKIESSYLKWYDPVLEPFLDKQITLLELGVLTGGSLLLWHDYFPQAKIVGIDIHLPGNFKSSERIHLFEGSQSDKNFLSDVAQKIAPGGFDIIIDDASHIGELTKIAFWHLFDNYLNPGGLYIIEDWGTGYWDDWVDGKSVDNQPDTRKGIFEMFKKSKFWKRFASKSVSKSLYPCHSYGMVGFVKQLVDEQGAADVTRKNLNGKPVRESKFENMIITPSIVFIKKRQD
jgi:hypothetical protein